MRSSLYALAVGTTSPAGLWVDRAIDLACQLVADGSEAPLLDARDHETAPSRREQIGNEMRRILRDNMRPY
jgi:hypothetical protein